MQKNIIKKVLKIILLVFILICVLIIYGKIFKRKNAVLNGNSSNSGLVIQDSDDNIYYYKYGNGIFKLNKNGEEKLIDEKNAYALNLIDRTLYYLSTENMNKVAVKSINLDTKEIKRICEITTSVNRISVYKDNIYYITYKNDGGITRINKNSLEEKNLIQDNIKDFQIDFASKKIYFVNNSNQICSSELDGSKIKILNEDSKVNKIQIIGEWIYYYDINENALFRINTNGKNQTLISTLVKNDTYNVFEKNIYYLDEESKSIMRMQIGKSNNIEKVVELDTIKTKINVTNEELYYLDKSKNEEQVYQIFKVKLNGEDAEPITY